MNDNNYKYFISGSLSGFSQIIVAHPIDTLKIWNQVNLKHSHNFKNLYSGIKYPLISNIFITSGIFGIYNYFFKKTNNNFVSGFIAGSLVTPIINISDIYKIKYQNKISLKMPFYRGIYLTLFRESFACGIYFSSYNYFKNNFDNKLNNNINNFISGGLAGITSWFITYPIDTIKTRIQTKNISLKNAIKDKKFFKGLSICLLRAFVVNSIGFCTYEYFNNYL